LNGFDGFRYYADRWPVYVNGPVKRNNCSAAEGSRMAAGVAKLVSAYERGVVTRPEAVNELLQLAAEVPPATLAANLPSAWLADLRQDCERFLPCPPAGGMLVLSSVCAGPDHDPEAARRAFEASWRAGLVAWQAFFGLGAAQTPPQELRRGLASNR
jgi:hypothetical protein